jgi:hypothetical protein
MINVIQQSATSKSFQCIHVSKLFNEEFRIHRRHLNIQYIVRSSYIKIDRTNCKLIRFKKSNKISLPQRRKAADKEKVKRGMIKHHSPDIAVFK